MNKHTIAICYSLLVSVIAAAQQDAAPPEIAQQLSEEKAAYHLPQKGLVQGRYLNGMIHYKGQVQKGRLQGAWQSWYTGNLPCDAGTFQKGIPDGAWTVWYNNGNPRFVRTYSEDKWRRFELERLRYHPKRIASPLAELAQKNREKAEVYINAHRSFCDPLYCTADENTGVLRRLYENSSSDHYHPLFEKGLLHGLFINYFPDGTVKDSGDYENGLPHGPWLHYTAFGQSYWSGYYHHGEKDKEWKLYESSGQLLRIIGYNKGKELWRKEIRTSPAP
jgi:antitoxin component YwqK of YwqJK toxin-antitoxin module